MAIKQETGFLRQRRKGGNWSFCLYINGRLWERSTGETDKRRAEVKSLELAKVARALAASGKGPTTLAPAIVAEVARIEEEVSKNQAHRVLESLTTVLKGMGDVSLEKVDTTALDRYQRQRIRGGVAASTLHKELCYVRRLLRQNGFRIDAPQKLPGATETPCRAFTPEELREFIEASDTYPATDPGRYTPLWLILAATGARPTEMVPSPRSTHTPLLKSEINLEDCTVMIRSAKQRAGKRGKVARVKVARPILDAVVAQAEGVPGPCVFPEMDLSKVFDRILAKTSIPRIDATGQKLMAHSFRHYFATQVAESGANAFVLMNALRHADTRMTSRYTERATAALEIDLSNVLIRPLAKEA